ncbi:MAG: SagB/ThcOx family dehydrogenase [Tannerellaceae bacterium]|jgi:SagB-type dehydrogenase family enzyme|nr:SagB/ThcOx family dehydrogenase [Tannerellaceae bacterium]
MRSLFTVAMASCLFVGCAFGQEKEIKLVTPDRERGEGLMKVLEKRKSERTFSEKELSAQDLSDLLWAANGVNRPDGRRTAPSAVNAQEVDVFVLTKEGAYLYDAGGHLLRLLTAGDFRTAVAAGQAFAAEAPVSIVLAADLSRLRGGDERTKLIGAVDVGIVCQNINVACAALGLATVPRATMDKETLTRILQLKESHLLLMNNPVGYPKE